MKRVNRDEWVSKNEWKREKFRVYAHLERWEKKANIANRKGKRTAIWSVLSPDTGKWWSVGESLEPITNWGRAKVR